jgi:hypothetical protein
MRQRERAIETQNRKMVAAATGRQLKDVHPEEVGRGFDSDGFATAKLPSERVKKVRKPQKQWARRESVYANAAE